MTPATTLREQIVSLISAIILAVIAGLVAKYGRDRNANAAPTLQQSAITTLTMLAATVVTATWQTTVAALKDPERPGEWDAAAKAAAFNVARNTLMEIGSKAIETLKAQGLTPIAVEILLRSIIESEVAKLNLTVQTAQPTVIETTVVSADDSSIPADRSGTHKPS